MTDSTLCALLVIFGRQGNFTRYTPRYGATFDGVYTAHFGRFLLSGMAACALLTHIPLAWQMFVHLRQIDDVSVCADLMRAGILQSGALDLEFASMVLTSLNPLLASDEEEYQLVALEAVDSLLRNFGPLIRSNRAAVPGAVGVDLNAEARQQRCQACFERFVEIRASIDQLSTRQGRVGTTATNLRAQMQSVLLMG